MADTSTLGRPRSFDEALVLDQVTALFWRQGYAATSMSDIVEATGVHKPSLYRTFGSKEELFATVLRRYLDVRLDAFARFIESAGTGVEAVQYFLDLFEDNVVEGAGRDGCLLVMASNELHGTAPGFENFGSQSRGALRAALSILVERVQPDGESSDELVASRSTLLLTCLQGLQVISRSGDLAEIRRHIDAVRDLVDTWR
jgi:AcrR family transcriptional regulator